jgi:hypothetical protein
MKLRKLEGADEAFGWLCTLAQQPRKFGRGRISALANQAGILKMPHKTAAKIKDIPVADRGDLLPGSFAKNLAVNDPGDAFSLIIIDEVAHWKSSLALLFAVRRHVSDLKFLICPQIVEPKAEHSDGEDRRSTPTPLQYQVHRFLEPYGRHRVTY